jgi:hypothetical protein
MAWWGYFMAKHTDILDKVAEEVRDVLGGKGDTSSLSLQLEHDDLARFPYTRATLQVCANTQALLPNRSEKLPV